MKWPWLEAWMVICPSGGIGREAGMRLDIGLMHRLRGVAAFDDDLGVLEAGLGVALLEGDDLGDVGRLGRLRSRRPR